jgi:hypothetical protein
MACRSTSSIDLRARSTPRRGSDQPHPSAVLPLMPAECAVCRAGPAVADQYCGRDADRAYAASAERVKAAGILFRLTF